MGQVRRLGGQLGHVLTAHAIGGSYVAYRDHIGGFFLLTIVSGVIIAGIGWRFSEDGTTSRC